MLGDTSTEVEYVTESCCDEDLVTEPRVKVCDADFDDEGSNRDTEYDELTSGVNVLVSEVDLLNVGE